MPMSDSRRQRQQLICAIDMVLLRDEVEEDRELLELLELVESAEFAVEGLDADCSGSAEGRWAAAVCSCSRRDASEGLDMNSRGVWRKASSGLAGSEKVCGL
jgi:hypothetical protein